MTETTYTVSGAPSIALITDLHGRPWEKILASLHNRMPRLICIAGDILYGSAPLDGQSPLKTQENILPFLRACAGTASTFLSLGNHELYLDEEDLRSIHSAGVTVLDNRYTVLDMPSEKDGTAGETVPVVIGGLTSGYAMDYRRFRASAKSPQRYPPRLSLSGLSGMATASEHRPDISWLSSFAEFPGYHVLLSHHPEYWPELKGFGIDLVLSGHAHGGQVRLFGRGLYAPGQGVLPRWTKGVYESRLIVSAGLSNTQSIPRIFNPTELVYINTPEGGRQETDPPGGPLKG